MANKRDSFELLKTHSGIIHRQPIFIADKLDVDSYHLSFLSKDGQKLDDDTPLPKFIEELSSILPVISEKNQALLSMPESWREELITNTKDDDEVNFTFDVGSQATPGSPHKYFSFAQNASAESEDGDSKTLLIDLSGFSKELLSKFLPKWRKRHPVLQATNVHQQNEFSFCTDNDLDLLQGNFYTLPAIDDSRRLLPSVQVLMELLVRFQDPDVQAADLAAIISLDIALSYKLLRLVNSAFFGLRKEISSIQQAIILLGFTKVKTWASLLSLSGVDNKPKELRVVAMTRAKMCELLAKYYQGDPETFFTVGLFSTLDAIIDKPMSSLVSDLPLSVELNHALQHFSGGAGLALRDTLHYEKGNWEALNSSPIPVEILARTYLDALNWSKALNSQLQVF